MGYLVIDHRGGQGIDDKAGTLQEYDTVSCGHCQAVIAVLTRPTEKVYLDNVDIARATQHGQHLGHEYKGKRPCRRCKKPLCRVCHARGVCEPLSEFLERLERRKG